MSEPIAFELADPPPLGFEEECDHACHRLKGHQLREGVWLLGIDEGHVDIKCAVCKCTFDGVADGSESIYTMVDIPVYMEFQKDCPGVHYESAWCDCDWYFNLSPTRERGHG